jgi:hypothetical protein
MDDNWKLETPPQYENDLCERCEEYLAEKGSCYCKQCLEELKNEINDNN